MSIQLFRIDCLNGGPTLSTIPENMYWKEDIKKRVVFSEFFTLDFWVSNCGGMNLRIRQSKLPAFRMPNIQPCLPLDGLKANQLNTNTQQDLAQQRCENLSRHKASSWSLSRQGWIGTSPSHCETISWLAALYLICLRLTEYCNW